MIAKFLFNKFSDNLIADKLFLLNSYLSFPEKISYISRKYFSILTNAKYINYLGKDFSYDSRFIPFNLQFYPHEIDFLDKLINFSKIKTVLDIGANVGQWSFTVKSFYPQTKIYSFEPNKQIFDYLIINSSGFNNWKIFNYAIGLKNGKSNFYYPEGASAAGSIIKKAAEEFYASRKINRIEIEVISLYQKNLKRLGLPKEFDLVKVDVEGYELNVIKSLKYLKFRYLTVEIGFKGQRKISISKIKQTIKRDLKKEAVLLGVHTVSKQAFLADAIFSLA